LEFLVERRGPRSILRIKADVIVEIPPDSRSEILLEPLEILAVGQGDEVVHRFRAEVVHHPVAGLYAGEDHDPPGSGGDFPFDSAVGRHGGEVGSQQGFGVHRHHPHQRAAGDRFGIVSRSRHHFLGQI